MIPGVFLIPGKSRKNGTTIKRNVLHLKKRWQVLSVSLVGTVQTFVAGTDMMIFWNRFMAEENIRLNFPENEARVCAIREPLSTPAPIPAPLVDWLTRIAARLQSAAPSPSLESNHESHDPSP